MAFDIRTLSKEQAHGLARATLKKIKNAGEVRSPEARLVFAIFEQAVMESLGWVGTNAIASTGLPPAEMEADAKKFLSSSQCVSYLSLIGIDYEYAMDKVRRLQQIKLSY